MFSFHRTALVTSLAIGLVATTANVARADDSAALAETLFQQAKALVAKGAYAEACPKLAESQRIDPGDGTLLALAVCHEAQGKLAAAWSEYTTLANKADVRHDRAQRARDRIAAIEPKLAHVSVVVPEATKRSCAPGATIEILHDGAVIRESAWGTPIPTEPGVHIIEARAEGKRSVRVEVNATANGRVEVVVPPFTEAPRERSTSSWAPRTAEPPAPQYPTRSSGTALRVTGITLGAVGLAAIGVGTYFGVRAMELSDRAKAGCDSPGRGCSDDSLTTNADAKSAALISNITIASGATAAVSGLVLYLIAPRNGPAVTPYGDPRGSAGVLVTTTF